MASVTHKDERQRRSATAVLQVAVALVYALSCGSISAAASPVEDRQTILKLTQEWLTQGWRHMPNDPPFDFKANLGRFYDWSAKDVYLFDDFDPQKRVARSPGEYGAIWNAALPLLKSFSNRIVGNPDIQVAGNLGVETVVYEISFDIGDGKVHQNRILDTVVWRRTTAGWKIIREQGSGLSSTVLP